MKDLENTVFDESVDGYTPVVPGVYPAHVVELSTKDQKQDGTKFANDSVVFNITFSLADECKKLKVKKMTKNGSGTSSTGADTTVTFVATPLFQSTPNVGISVSNMATGDYYAISSKTNTGFIFNTYNSGGSRVARNFEYIAKGY